MNHVRSFIKVKNYNIELWDKNLTFNIVCKVFAFHLLRSNKKTEAYWMFCFFFYKHYRDNKKLLLALLRLKKTFLKKDALSWETTFLQNPLINVVEKTLKRVQKETRSCLMKMSTNWIKKGFLNDDMPCNCSCFHI